MEGRIVKEIFIVVLLFIVVLFVLGILLYDFIPGKKENIKSVEYVADNSVQDVLDEIKENTGVDVKEQNSDVPLKSYSIDSGDLDVYASENSYESGKSDPFAETSEPADSSFEKKITNANTSNTQSSNDTKKDEKKKEEVVNNIVVTNTATVSETKQEVKKEETKQEAKKEEPKKEETKETKNEVTTGTFFEKKDSK